MQMLPTLDSDSKCIKIDPRESFWCVHEWRTLGVEMVRSGQMLADVRLI